VVKPRKISDIAPLFRNLAQTSHYEVKFGGLPNQLGEYLSQRGISSRFTSEDAGLLCYNALLPTTQISTINVQNYTGITETFANARNYQDISLEFYVDSNYKTLKFLEHWMEFIASGSNNPIRSKLSPISQNVDTGYIIRLQYPEYYKSNKTKIIKFDRDYKKEIEYTFIGLYPYNIASIPVSYGQSDAMKMSVSFKIDRYVIGKSLSIDINRNEDNNKQPNQKQETPAPQPRPRLVPKSPGSIPSNGVELYPSDKTLYENLYGTNKQ
jgi:hypothetical protein